MTALQRARQTVRKALESTYEGRSTVVEYQKVKDEWGMTNFQEVTVLEDQPCKLSFETLTSTSGDPVATVTQGVKLFLSPDVVIKAGSKIIVTQNGRTTDPRWKPIWSGKTSWRESMAPGRKRPL